MSPRILSLFFASQSLFLLLGGWAFTAGGPVWLLVGLFMLMSPFLLRSVLQAARRQVLEPLEQENRSLRAALAPRTQCSGTHSNSELQPPSEKSDIAEALQRRIDQLEAELRIVCGPAAHKSGPDQEIDS